MSASSTSLSSSSISDIPSDVAKDQLAISALGGLQQLFRIFNLVSDSSPTSLSTTSSAASTTGLPAKTVVNASNVIRGATQGCFDNANGILLTNKISVLIDVLAKHLKLAVPDTVDVHSSPTTSFSLGNNKASGHNSGCHDPVVNSLLLSLTVMMEALQAGPGGGNGGSSGGGGGGNGIGNGSGKSNGSGNNGGGGSSAVDLKSKLGVDEAAYASYTQDVVSYVISTGVLDKLNVILFQVTVERASGSGGEDAGASAAMEADAAEFLTRILGFLTALTQLLMLRMDKDKKHEGRFIHPVCLNCEG